MTDSAFAALGSPASLGGQHIARLLNELPVIVWSTDAELRITSHYGGALAQFGLSAGVGDGRHVTADFDPAAAAPVIAAHRAALRGESSKYETTVGGWAFSARLEPLIGANGFVVGVVGFAFDVTDQRRVELALRESETRLRAIIESEPECVKLVDRNGLLLEMNPAGLTMIEADGIDQVRGQAIDLCIVPEHRGAFNDLLARVFAGGSGTLEFEIIGLKGTRRWLNTHAVPLRGPDGTITASLGITRDVTERKQYEAKLQASRAALRRLATRHQDVREGERTRIAREIHDSLGQALTALKLQLAALQEAAAKEGSPLAGSLCETALMVDDMVKGVRRIATELRPPILDQLGLPAAVEWLAHDFARRTGMACRADTVIPKDSVIGANAATALFRIVQEALTNVSRHAGASRVHIELGVKSECVTLEITDDGGGITELAATGPGSLGILGMRERAAALGGVLEVGPATGGGTRVAAWLPPNVRGTKRQPPRSAP